MRRLAPRFDSQDLHRARTAPTCGPPPSTTCAVRIYSPCVRHVPHEKLKVMCRDVYLTGTSAAAVTVVVATDVIRVQGPTWIGPQCPRGRHIHAHICRRCCPCLLLLRATIARPPFCVCEERLGQASLQNGLSRAAAFAMDDSQECPRLLGHPSVMRRPA